MSPSLPLGLAQGTVLPCARTTRVVQNSIPVLCQLPTRPVAIASERERRVHAHDLIRFPAPRWSSRRIAGSICSNHSSSAGGLVNSRATDSMYSCSLAQSVSSSSSAKNILGSGSSPQRLFCSSGSCSLAESIASHHSPRPSTSSCSLARSGFHRDMSAQLKYSSSSIAQGVASSHGPSPSRSSCSLARSIFHGDISAERIFSSNSSSSSSSLAHGISSRHGPSASRSSSSTAVRASQRGAAARSAKAGAPSYAVATEEGDAGMSEDDRSDRSAVEPTGTAPHIPVLLGEVLSFFEGRKVHTFVDGTLGAGGHSSAILRAHPELQHLVALDLDPRAHAEAGPRLAAAVQQSTGRALAADGASSASGSVVGALLPAPQLSLVRANFGELGRVLAELSPPAADGGCDGILLDLGMSSMQVDDAERGFSFLRDGPLDMRMDPEAALSAEALVNTWGEAELGALLRDWGEERRWRMIARHIVEARGGAPITTTGRLVQLIGGPRTGRGLHPATRTFQALRMAVNGEQAALRAALPAAVRALREGGGRLAVISFHSLEDRIVKRAFLAAAADGAADAGVSDQVTEGQLEGWAAKPKRASKSKYPAKYSREEAAVAATLGAGSSNGASRADLGSTGGTGEYPSNHGAPRGYRVLTKRPVVAEEPELRVNARSRSAKLRVLERL